MLTVNTFRTLTKRPIQTLTRMIHLTLKMTESPDVNINAWIRETTIRMFQCVLLFSDGVATDLFWLVEPCQEIEQDQEWAPCLSDPS